MDSNASDRGFIPYPTNRVVGTIADAEHAGAAVTALVEAGFDRQFIDVLHGDEDVTRLDPTGTAHGVLERLQRALIRTGGPAEEYKHLMHHVQDVRAGRFVIMVLAPERERRTIAADILDRHGAEFVASMESGPGGGSLRPACPQSPTARQTPMVTLLGLRTYPGSSPRRGTGETLMRLHRCSTRTPSS
jgi:hypothetical protein